MQLKLMKRSFSGIVSIAMTMWLGFAAGPANAVPTLQLGIVGGVYDWTTQTVISTGPNFSLYAYLTPDRNNLLTDTYYLSMAVTPSVDTSANLGSFVYDGNTVNVTSDMTYGTPPIDAFSASSDAGDLAPHGVFPAFFEEVGFSFSGGNQSGLFNTQGHPTFGPQSGAGMYYNLFSIDTSNLAAGYAIHFDLYNTRLCSRNKGQCGGTTDTDITQFAPFSHDAQSIVMTSIPEPQTYAMLIVGLGMLGLVVRRKTRNA